MYNEKIYILLRKIKAFGYSLMFVAMRIFKVNEKKIVFSSFEGGGYGCNPKYIAEELHKREMTYGRKYKMVWLVNDMELDFPSYMIKSKNTMLRRSYHMSTAKIWIDNSRQKYGTIKRKNQYYIQTWHGQIGFKPIGNLRKTSFSKIAQIVSMHDGKLVDCWLSNSKWSTKTFREAFYNEPIVKTGSPRCDAIINQREKLYDDVRKKINAIPSAKFVLYAPTFRGGSQSTTRTVVSEKFSLDFHSLINCLQKKFGGDWYVLLRVHPQLALSNHENAKRNYGDKIINVSHYEDMYELVAAADVFITDYSSAAFDVASINTPVFLYADDFKEYIKERGGLLWNEEEMPFEMASDNQKLRENILNFNNYDYVKKINKFKEELEILEDGHASERVADMVETYLAK